MEDSLKAADSLGTDGILAKLEPWIRQNSYSADVERVNTMGKLLAKDFEGLGLKTDVHAGKEVGDHFLWSTQAWRDASGPKLLLVGHHDTVFPPGTFERWEIAEGKLHGPGVLDMKGGLSVVWAALYSLHKAGVLESVPLALLCVGDEEIGSIESHTLTASLAKQAKAALVFEGGRTSDEIITRRKGTGSVGVVVKGKAAHAGNHHKDGINAIRAISNFVEAAEQITNYEQGATVNVGLISGGEARNTVPRHAECHIDLRFLSEDAGHDLVEKLKSIGEELSSPAEFSFSGGVRRPPLDRTKGSAKMFETYSAAAKSEGLGHSECPLVGGGSDANNVSAVGTPAIDGMGPRGRGFHTHKEYIEVETLMPKVRTLLRFIADWDDLSQFLAD